jgi:succinate-semialdehyde dehydrogenase/glutarate-semialdehyde dehydrogenase
MQLNSINPATEETLKTFESHSSGQVDLALEESVAAFSSWRRTGFSERSSRMNAAAACLRENKARLAALITAEMGKPVTEAEAEIEKCAWNCEYYAGNAESFLQKESRASSASESYVQYTPLGTVLAIMPWNFPFWQLFRFAAPALMAGNTAILKHASNVPQCALAIEEIFAAAGFPKGTFRTVLVPGSETGSLIEDPRIAAITLTGSEAAGSEAAALAGRTLKKTVLELGGSDPFIVLPDADIEAAAMTGVRARYQNAGQSCIAAKRFILVGKAYEEFRDRFLTSVRCLKTGDPMVRDTQIGPLARKDLLDTLDRQLRGSLQKGARLLTGGRRRPGRGYYFEPTVIDEVTPDMPAACEEVFGPVAALLRASDEEEAVRLANCSPYGLGANLWTGDLSRARSMARDIEAGQIFVNGMVMSDPRLPFGGVKRSGYGRELSEFGIREFVNIQTVWIGPQRIS